MMSHHPTIGEQTCRRRLYNRLERTFYQLHMATNVDKATYDVISYAQNRLFYCQGCKTQRFSAIWSLDFVTLDISEPF